MPSTQTGPKWEGHADEGRYVVPETPPATAHRLVRRAVPALLLVAVLAMPVKGDAAEVGAGPPDASTTGVPPGITLRPYRGPLTITTEGTVLDGYAIEGCLDIKADGVTIRNSRIRCASGTTSDRREQVVRTHRGYGGTVLEHVELDGGGTPWTMGVMGSGTTVRHSNLHGLGDGIKGGSQSLYEHNYIHSLAEGEGQHNDGIQISQGRDIVIRGNRIVRPPVQTSAILLKADLGPVSDVVIEYNWLDGGNYTLYLIGKGPSPRANGSDTPHPTRRITVRSNIIGNGYRWGPLLERAVEDLIWECNRWAHTGEVLAFTHGDNRVDTSTTDVIVDTGCDGGGLAGPTTPPRPGVTRIAADDRVGTAVALSRGAFAGADTVVLARADAYADALAAGPLAARHGAPVLLTHPARLEAPVAGEIRRLGASRAILVGGPAALSPEVAAALRSRQVEVWRIGGPTRFATAARVAADFPPGDEILVAEGASHDPRRGWPDALSASAMGAALGVPVLLTHADRLPPETAELLRPAVRVIVVGGPAAVSEAVLAAIDARAGEVGRVGGADRSATSVAVLEELRRRGYGQPGPMLVAGGGDWPDGLVAGVAAQHLDGRLLLLPGGQALGDGLDWLGRNRELVTGVLVVGGRNALAEGLEEAVRTSLGL